MTDPNTNEPSTSSQAATDGLSKLAEARAGWLDTAARTLAGHEWVIGAWLVGSLGRGDGDPYSDVDLVVAVTDSAPASVFTDPVVGLDLPGPEVYRRPKPRNAPAGGAYLAVGVLLASLPVLVDVFVWPASTARVSAGARVMFDRNGLPASPLGFIPLLDAHRTSDPRGSDPNAPGTVLMLVQLAAKYLARGNTAKLAGICHQLAIPAVGCDARLLRTVLDQRIDLTAQPHAADGVQAVHRLLDIVDPPTKAV